MPVYERTLPAACRGECRPESAPLLYIASIVEGGLVVML